MTLADALAAAEKKAGKALPQSDRAKIMREFNYGRQ
jgi:hypothetical protein